MPRFVFLEFTRPLRCHCGKAAAGARDVAYLIGHDGLPLDIDQRAPFDAHQATYKMRAPCGHDVTLRPDGSSIIYRVAHNTPLGPTITVMLAEAPSGDDLLGRLFDESQRAAISQDVAASGAYATAAGELIAAFQNVRQQLISAAAEAKLANVTFSPEGDVNEHLDSTDDGHGGEMPVVEFALTARNAGSQWVLNIRGSAARSLREPARPAYYLYAPLMLTLHGNGLYRERNWQPMAQHELDEGDDDTVARVAPGYLVTGHRLAMVIAELARRT